MVINPATPAAVLEEILPELDLVLVMTVNPGFGHQHFLHSTLPKIGRVRQMVERVNPRSEVEVDGGVDAQRRHWLPRRAQTSLLPVRRFLARVREWPLPSTGCVPPSQTETLPCLLCRRISRRSIDETLER